MHYLAQNMNLHKHKLMLRWVVALSSIPLLGVVTAFGIVSQQIETPAALQVVLKNIKLPNDSQTSTDEAHASVFWRNEYVRRGDMVADLLQRLNINDAAVSAYLGNAPAAASFRQLPVGKSVQAEMRADDSLVALRYLDRIGNQVVIERDASGFSMYTLPVQMEQRLLLHSGEIESSLFAATDAAGFPESIAYQMTEIFGGGLDFHRDLRKGDKFNVIYEMNYSNGEPMRSGRILAAEFINQGTSHKVVYFQDNDERLGKYYTPEGRSMLRAFLRSPLEYSRVSSGFKLSRFHPVLAKWRKHNGVDYAAPTGTKVKATADGTLVFVGKQGGYGNVVKIHHAGGYTTVYAHLSQFASALRRGQRVTQGEVIGYVGMTGLVSGPHLHYEFMVNGQHRDPMRVVLPDASPIPSDQKIAFLNATRELTERLELFTHLAQLD
jgi:murein DD-endopeptidase MepM/ murein hydrolase activator NlpD